MGTKYLPHGTTISINSQPVGGLTSIGTPDRSRGAAETTDSNSAWDRTFLPGLRNAGTVALSFRHMPDDVGQQELNHNYQTNGASAVVHCVITLPNAHTFTFDAFVSAPPKGDLALVDDTTAEQTATLQVAGAVIVTS